MTTITQLARIPELAALAFTGWGHQWRSQEETTHKPVAGPRVPIDLDTFDALRPDAHGLLFELTQAVRATLEEARRGGDYDLEAAEQVTWVGECDWLTRHRAIWEADDYLADYVPDQVRDVYRRLMALIGERPTYRPNCDACGQRLTPMDNATWYSCPACGREHTLDAALKELGKVTDATLRELADLIDRPLSTLKEWVQRGWLTPTRRGVGGKLYPIEDARNLADMVTRGRKHTASPHETTAV